ncbi:type I-B CRISPR-associated protein Cas7/Cst2/DevR [Oxynema sp. CENA135]|uniref:type I-B CRISPR-associated protein Cas7/Cst2/DevR n=1 Tax=Oxynema sp. CENA135 TaxID=984206 RepID=UPI00190D3F34|nr:type I-B CRISPR-associated protein Cas7/Cst2/DevR [Oxynema sp. CENA135]MBK4731068.1 type I-B CRISPR-associated protein Cas7/Cst2/DevR [Oxynema sp. CENA135]
MTQHEKPLNLFATVLTHAAPSSNYRGESEQNRTVLQKIARGDEQYAIVSADSIRNAMRETLAELGFPCNRERVQDEGQLAVSFESLPNPDEYADDWAFGYMVAKEKTYADQMKHPAKRDSIVRLNTAVALAPYRFEASLHQSPANVDRQPRTKVFWFNSKDSALLHREASYTAFQYPLALSGRDCQTNPNWTRGLLQTIAQLNNVAGAHARSYFEFAPRSIIVRLTPKLVAGFDTYGFNADGHWCELHRLNDEDLPAEEFWLGGALVRDMAIERADALREAGAKLYANPDRLFEDLAEAFLGGSDRAAA